MGADKSAQNTPKYPPKNVSAQIVCPVQKFGISMKKGFIGRPQSVFLMICSAKKYQVLCWQKRTDDHGILQELRSEFIMDFTYQLKKNNKTNAQSIYTHYFSFEIMGRFTTLKKQGPKCGVQKIWVDQNMVWTFLCYSEREEAAWPLLLSFKLQIASRNNMVQNHIFLLHVI